MTQSILKIKMKETEIKSSSNVSEHAFSIYSCGMDLVSYGSFFQENCSDGGGGKTSHRFVAMLHLVLSKFVDGYFLLTQNLSNS